MSENESKSEYDRCPACNSNEWMFVREGGDLARPEFKKSFELTRCSSCGHVIQNPKPDERELDAAYSDSKGYAAYRAAWTQSGWPLWKILRAWTMHRRISWLKRYGTGRELLEVGCGAGDFMMAAHRAGWNVRAVEFNRRMVEMIVGKFGFDVRVGGLASCLWNEGQFDVVAFWNVLEHVPDPLRDLSIAANYLRPGGRVFLGIPTRQAAEHGQWFGQYWAILDLPRHLNFYNETTLSQLCGKVGFDLIVYKTPFVQTAWCYYMSSWNYANRDGKKRMRWLRFIALAAVVTLYLPCIAVQTMRKHGTEAVAVLVKR